MQPYTLYMGKWQRREFIKQLRVVVPIVVPASSLPGFQINIDVFRNDLESREGSQYILVNADLSGAYQEEGLQQVNAVQLYVDELNKSLPHSCKWGVLVSDNQCRSENVVSSIESALEGVEPSLIKVIAGGSSSKVTAEQAKYAAKYNWVHLPGTCQRFDASQMSGAVAPIGADLANSSELILHDIHNRFENPKVLVLSDDYEWGRELEAEQVKIAEREGLDAEFVRINIFFSHFDKSLRHKIQQADVLVVNRYSNHLKSLIDAIQAQSKDVKPIYLPSISDINLKYVETGVFSNVMTLLPTSLLRSNRNQLEKLYEAKFRRQPLQAATRVFAQLSLIADQLASPKRINNQTAKLEVASRAALHLNSTAFYDEIEGKLVSKMAVVGLGAA